ncbi:hypothetical protein H1V43_36605 [Streptomyces sp. PSKA54]|uniref:Uncharacterized protein n=1 Tax=Streptomyces himalayensis subsp. aureolus TaxID=2758039 RepID=A0A7W2D906_9ACTN|nr:hypothetical protein [Streptomyces himalayensis]MBA4866725.1 hypothetical protein [Streptomyces himalayensis subsp. aureolus]
MADVRSGAWTGTAETPAWAAPKALLLPGSGATSVVWFADVGDLARPSGVRRRPDGRDRPQRAAAACGPLPDYPVRDRTHPDFERLLQRMVWLMPNAFFVITGRDRLQWAEDGLQGQLDWTGPTSWPGLAGHVPGPRAHGDPAVRQILVGDFSPEDCDDHLARRLAHNGQPLIGPDLRRAITARSHGLPLYLDLAVLRFLEIRRSGRVPQPGDFGDFPALISRTLSDLTSDERHVLRSVSLLDAFSVPLATQVAGLAHDAAALRLTKRPFSREDLTEAVALPPPPGGPLRDPQR